MYIPHPRALLEKCYLIAWWLICFNSGCITFLVTFAVAQLVTSPLFSDERDATRRKNKALFVWKDVQAL
jgi:hypothetical protein